MRLELNRLAFRNDLLVVQRSSAACSPATFSGLLRCGRVSTHAVERRGPVGIALCGTSTAGFPALHLSATCRHGPFVAPGLESTVL